MHPEWLKVRYQDNPTLRDLKATAKGLELATVCQEAQCPNLFDCWSEGTATFMLMGDTCTRACRFCHVKTGNPQGWLDEEEPEKLARTIVQAGWSYVVLTSVDRDDLPDGGAAHLARCVSTILKACPTVTVEVLAPDFKGDLSALRVLLASGVSVFAHNVETVKRLQGQVRDRRATYEQSLQILEAAKAIDPYGVTKTSLMLGLGETLDEVKATMHDLRQAGVDAITFGQYLQPSPKHLPVSEWIPPDVFEQIKAWALEDYGFAYCASGPLVRSSYKAGEYYLQALASQRLLNKTLEKNRAITIF
jgi:lipoic acid synthetase